MHAQLGGVICSALRLRESAMPETDPVLCTTCRVTAMRAVAAEVSSAHTARFMCEEQKALLEASCSPIITGVRNAAYLNM